MHSSSEEHMEAIYKILKYLKRTPRRGLLFQKREQLLVEAFMDALTG